MTDFEINKATRSFSEQQAALAKELVEGAMEQAKALSGEKDMAAVVESQKSYLQGLQARLIDAAKVTKLLPRAVKKRLSSSKVPSKQ